MEEDEKRSLAGQMFEGAIDDPSRSQELVAQLLRPGLGLDVTLEVRADFTDRKVIEMTPTTMNALVESARFTHAVPAEQKTKQAEEETKREIKRAEEETKRVLEQTKRSVHDMIKSAYPLVGVIAGLVAMGLVPDHAKEIAIVVGVLQIPTVVEKVSDGIAKRRKRSAEDK
jgi:hypothetical protein